MDQGSWAKGDGLIGHVKAAAGALVAAFAVDKIYEGVKSVIDLGSSLNDTAQKTGATVEGLQELGYVAKLNSSDMESVAHGLTKLSRGLDEAATKSSGPAYDALQRLGIPMKSLEGLTVDQKFQTIATKLSALPDGTQKTALAMDLLGKSGAELIPTINDLGKNGDKLRQEFKDMGGEMSGATASGLDDLGDNIDRTKAQLGALKTQVVVALMPQIKEIIDGIMGWVKANKELISSGIHTFVAGLVTAFQIVGDVIGFVVDGVHAIEDVFQAAFAGDTGAQALLIGVGTVLAGIIIPLLVTWALSMLEIAASTLIAILPFIAIGVAVAAIAYGVLQLVKHWDKVKEVAVRVGAAIKSAFQAAVSWVADKIQWIMDKLQALIDTAKGAANVLTAPGRAVGNKIYDTIHGTDDGLDHSDENQDQSTTSVERRKAASDAYYQRGATVNPSNSTATTQNQITNNITLNSTNADPKAVATEFRAQIGEHFDRVLRDTHAATGGADQ